MRYKITHPPRLVNVIGAKEDEVLPIHTTMSPADVKCGIIRVYEPRRKCEYPVHAAKLKAI